VEAANFRLLLVDIVQAAAAQLRHRHRFYRSVTQRSLSAMFAFCPLPLFLICRPGTRNRLRCTLQ
jgi:hypothetical protein